MLVVTLVAAAWAGTPTWSSLSSDSGWTADSTNQTDDAGPVQIDTRTIDGVACFRATATSHQTPEALFGVASDIVGSLKWSTAGVTDAKVLSKSGSNLEYYQYLDVPGWTMTADRFWFLKGSSSTGADGAITFTWERLVDGGAHATAWQSVKSDHPEAVEPPVNVGGWIFTPTGGGTQVRYYLCTDSGGSIPGFVQTAATRQTLPGTLSDVIREAAKRSGVAN